MRRSGPGAVVNADLELGRRFVNAYTVPETLLCCAVTGAHLYGFPSVDSDLELRGIHLAPTRSLLGLRRDQRSSSLDVTDSCGGVECNFTSNEAGEALAILLSGNGNMLERILSPLQVVENAHLPELQAITQRSLSQRFAKHYGSFFHGCRRELLRAPTVKGLLYAYRMALTGIELLQTGHVETNLTLLARRYGFDGIDTVVAAKRAGSDHGFIDPAVLQRHDSALDRLQTQLAKAEAGSVLPLAPTNVDELNEWLIERRLDSVR